MTNTRKKFISLFIAACVMLTAVPSGFAKTNEAPAPAYFDLPVNKSTVKVGLCFEKSAVKKAELELKGGKSFLLGYYDFSRCFHKLAKIESDSVHILSADLEGKYADSKLSTWHILMDDEFDKYSDSVKLCERLKNSFPAYIDGKFRAMSGTYESEYQAKSAIRSRGLEAEPFCADEYTYLLTNMDEDKLLFLIDGSTIPALKPKKNDALILFNGNVYSGALQCSLNEGLMTVVNYVELEDYVKGVLPYEMVAKWPMEALKSQAVCARTYVFNNIDAFNELGFDLRNDTYSQVYKGMTAGTQETDTAAEQTAGCFVRYNGALCRIYYMSSDGGATASGENVFAKRRAYLAPVIDDNEDDLDYYNKSWKTVLRSSTVLRRLNNAGFELNNVKDIKAVTTDNGIVSELNIADKKGNSATLYGEDIFLTLGLNSLNFEVTGNGKDLWTFEGHGWGHNCGMSQWGAYGMAKDKGSQCEDIIGFYFSGAYIR